MQSHVKAHACSRTSRHTPAHTQGQRRGAEPEPGKGKRRSPAIDRARRAQEARRRQAQTRS
eukprot:3347093-Pleurochrysis_carterae.AAC.1